ncbi:hypothetical protein PF003_g26733 [Phytophthora fragariae]|nr:hypothetical protein PF003_g26733 [Phytophthora fragariae]
MCEAQLSSALQAGHDEGLAHWDTSPWLPLTQLIGAAPERNAGAASPAAPHG